MLISFTPAIVKNTVAGVPGEWIQLDLEKRRLVAFVRAQLSDYEHATAMRVRIGDVDDVSKGVDIMNGEYPPGVFLRGLKISDEKIRGLKFLRENLRGLNQFQSLTTFFSKFPLIFEGLIYCPKTLAATSLYNNDVQI